MVSADPQRSLSPRELGLALGVSESSVKRWIDAGRLPAKRTPGGHRRIELLSALEFLHSSRREVADPERLGLSDPSARALCDPVTLEARLFDHLARGRQDELQRDVMAALTVGVLEPGDLFDGPLRSAMSRIGALWQRRQRGIYVEHRATRILLAVLDRVFELYRPRADGPAAVGGSLAGDPSLVPTRMAAIVLAQRGLRCTDLGADTPTEALLEAADTLDARLVWLSVSYVADLERQSAAVDALVASLAERGRACILGGREIHRLSLSVEGRARVGNGMRELAELGARIAAGSTSESAGFK